MSDATEDRPSVLLWVWEHYRLCVYDCPTLDAAAGMAEAFLDSGHGSAAGAEVHTGAGVQWVTDDELTAIYDRRPKPEPAAPFVARIFIDPPRQALDTARDLAPDWQEEHSAYHDRHEAMAEYERLRRTWGDRVRLVMAEWVDVTDHVLDATIAPGRPE